jgi:hypothetical protein
LIFEKKKQRLSPELDSSSGCESLLKERAAVKKKYQSKERKSNHKFEVVGGQELLVRVPLPMAEVWAEMQAKVEELAGQSECGKKSRGRAGRDADGASFGYWRGIAAQTSDHQPDRIVFVDGATRGTKRKALARRKSAAALDCYRALGGGETIPTHQRLSRTLVAEGTLESFTYSTEGGANLRSRLNSPEGRFTVPNIESRCNQLKLGHPHQIRGGAKIGTMDKELSVGQQKVLFDREATLELYRQTITIPGADSCSCIPCKNFTAQRGNVFPQEFVQFLTTLGIDPLKEWEAFDYEFGEDQSGHLYGGWFLFVGELAEGPDRDIGPQSKPFDYWFTTSFPTGTLPIGSRYCAVEFLARIPWVLSEAP